ncbi:hypothetical protein KJ708_09050, partial [bacterium]|nr:hypothetical protein [bacterium]MBU1916719.1 hypothetical protein [bacterium]
KNMSQLNIYVPDEMERGIRSQAKKNGKSISKFIADLYFDYKTGTKLHWQADFFESTIGSWKGKELDSLFKS